MNPKTRAALVGLGLLYLHDPDGAVRLVGRMVETTAEAVKWKQRVYNHAAVEGYDIR